MINLHSFISDFLSNLLASIVADAIGRQLHGSSRKRRIVSRSTVKCFPSLLLLIRAAAKQTLRELEDRFHIR